MRTPGADDVHAWTADERRSLADQLLDLAPAEQATPSLCAGWTVHDVVAHLVMPLQVGLPRMAAAVLLAGGDFDRANRRTTRRLARHPFPDLAATLHRQADTRFTPPGAGPAVPLLDVLVHGLDVRHPLGLHHDVPAPRLRAALALLATAPAGLVPRGLLDGLRWEADDADGVVWSHGEGPVVRGTTEALLLTLTGRAAALGELGGDGVPLVRDRLARR